jgi:Protein of unknown function (DUF3225)
MQQPAVAGQWTPGGLDAALVRKMQARVCGKETQMDLNIPEVVAEVTAAHDRYEEALGKNDVPVLNELFWNAPQTLRYGATENLYGHGAIAAFRGARGAPGIRDVTKVVVTTYGRDFATTNLEYVRGGENRIGRQSQAWVRMPEGWRIVAAHVSVML